MNNMAKMVMMNNGGRSGGSGGNRSGGNRGGSGGGSNRMTSSYDASSYDMSNYGSMTEYDEPESRRRRDRLGRYMESDERPEMNGEYAYATMGSYEDSPEMRRASMHAMPKNQIGFSTANVNKKFDQATAQEWTKGMKNADGSSGPHWTFDQVKAVMAQHNVSGLNNLFKRMFRAAFLPK